MLRPTFYSFETAKRALSTAQMGLDTVGHNISNVNTPGYTRQRVDQVTFNLGHGRSQYNAYGYNFPGQGAVVSGINQIRDPYLDRRFRTEASKVGELGTVSSGLDKLNLIFDEITKTGSHAKMSEFLTELDALIASADSPEQATVLRSKAKDLALVLNKNSIDIENAATQQMQEMESDVDSVNVLLEQIADLNVKIKEDNFYGNPSNENNDLRNLYIDQLSELIDIDIIKTPVKVTADLSVESVKITIRGAKPEAVLVDSGTYNSIEAQYKNPLKPNKDRDTYEYLDNVSYHLIDPMTKLPILPAGQREGDGDITQFFMTGTLKGHLNIMNGKSIDAKVGENTFRGIPYTQKALDSYASTLAEQMNKLNALKVWNPDKPDPSDPTKIIGGFDTIPRDLFVPSGVTGDVTEYTHIGMIRTPGSTTFTPQIQATLPDGSVVDATDWHHIDVETGDILKVDGTATGYNVDALERKLTARNIMISDAWANDPLYITRETLNNALYTNADGNLMSVDADGNMVDTGVHYSQIGSIGAGGLILDAYGNPLLDPTKTELTLDTLQRAITEVTDKPPVLADFFPDGTIDAGENLTLKNGTEPLDATAFEKIGPDGVTFVAATGADLSKWAIDEQGVLLDEAGDRVYLKSDTTTPRKAFVVTGLLPQVEETTVADVPPTFEDYFPGGTMGKTLAITETNPDGTVSDHLYEPGDFGPKKYDSFEGWSVNAAGELVDQNGDTVYTVNDIALGVDDFTQQSEYNKGVNVSIENDYLNASGQLVGKDGTTLYSMPDAAGLFGPGNADGTNYTSFEGWTIDANGGIRDADGGRVFLESDRATAAAAAPITIKDDPKNKNDLGLKQWNFPTAPASITDFINGGSFIAPTGATQEYAATDFLDEKGVPVSNTDFTQWTFDDEGYLIAPTGIADPATTRVSIAGNPSRKVNMSDLEQQNFPKFQPGEATPNDLLPGEKANGNLDQMKIMLEDTRTFANGFKGSFQEYLIGFQEDLANDKQTNDSLLSGTVNVMSGLADTRDGISAVSIDEEGISMMTYQNYYNAASRYMTTLDEALDKIINGMGTVGR